MLFGNEPQVDHFRIDGRLTSGDALSAADCAFIPFFHAFEALQARFKTFDLVRKRPRLEACWTRARGTEIVEFAAAAINAAVAEFTMVSSGRRRHREYIVARRSVRPLHDDDPRTPVGPCDEAPPPGWEHRASRPRTKLLS
jgi:hypothetical protein